jgi:hypothetical protein
MDTDAFHTLPGSVLIDRFDYREPADVVALNGVGPSTKGD